MWLRWMSQDLSFCVIHELRMAKSKFNFDFSFYLLCLVDIKYSVLCLACLKRMILEFCVGQYVFSSHLINSSEKRYDPAMIAEH